jgi:hypothetical protein
MPDGERTLGEAFRLIERQERACERRASTHVERDLFLARNGDVDQRLDEQAGRIAETRARQDGLETELHRRFEQLGDRQDRQRLAIITAIIGPVLTALITVVFVMSGIGQVAP